MELTGNLVKNLIRDFRQQLSGLYPDEEIRQFIYTLFEEYLGWPKTRIHWSPDAEIPEPALKSLKLALEELSRGCPIQYILQKTWFNETLLKVNSQVLVPRPETEELCLIIKSDLREDMNRPFAMLDIGTGSGCIAIDLKKHFPQSIVTAVDKSVGALETARENARVNHCEISFLLSDILEPSNWIGFGKYHIIVSNPPYIPESEKELMHRNVLCYEPAEALFVTDNDPLVFYRAISTFAIGHLNPPARLYFEINERFGMQVRALILSLGFDEVRILKDFHGKDRFAVAILKPLSTLPL